MKISNFFKAKVKNTNSITISAEEWTKVIHDTFDAAIKESFGMVPDR